MFRTHTVAGVLGASLLLAMEGYGQQRVRAHVDPAKLSQPQYRVMMENHIPVGMRDGVTLSTDVFLPDAPGTYPTLLWRTPYSNNDDGMVSQSRWYAERGYAVVVQDVRGTYDSGGTFVPFIHEADDGFDTAAWIGAQPWSNGKIGSMGGSYLGYTQIAAALRHSPHLKSMSASVTTGDVANNWVYINGAFFLGFALPWGGVEMHGHVMQNTKACDWPLAFAHLPVNRTDRAAGHTNPFYREWLQHPQASDPYWRRFSFEEEIAGIEVPFLVNEGWYDLFLAGALRDHAVLTTKGATPLARKQKRLMIGPWGHDLGVRNNAPGSATTGPDRSIDFGPEAELETRMIYLRWHDHWLKGIDNGVDTEPPIKIFVMGENYWRFEHEWPLARTQYTKYYLDSQGKANSAVGDGTLSTTAPRGASSVDTFVYDPLNPVPTLGGNTCCSTVPFGPWDQRKAEIRTDVLVYSCPTLKEPTEVTGPITMKLYAATTALDTDWTAKLVDVHPDGYAQNLQDGIIRARYRKGPAVAPSLLEPGKVYSYDIDLWATSHVFLPGHRIRLEVSSSNFPRFDRNLNTGEDPAVGTRAERATQTIHHSAQFPSHLVLPIIPRS